MANLTDLGRKLLQILVDKGGTVNVTWDSHREPYVYPIGAPPATRTALERRGFIEQEMVSGYVDRITITPAGRAALEEATK